MLLSKEIVEVVLQRLLSKEIIEAILLRNKESSSLDLDKLEHDLSLPMTDFECAMTIFRLLIPPENAAMLIQMKDGDPEFPHISKKTADEIFEIMYRTAKDPITIYYEGDFEEVVDDADELQPVIDLAIETLPNVVADYRKMKNEKVLGPLIGFVIKETKGSADAKVVKGLLLERLC